MPYTRYVLIIFGAGALAGLALVVANLPTLGLIASALMAAGLLFLPFALVVDWWRRRPWNDPAPQRLRQRTPSPRRRKNPAKSPRPRKRGARG